MARTLLGTALACLAASMAVAAPADKQPLQHQRTVVVDRDTWPPFNMASFDQDKVRSVNGFQYTLYWDRDKTLVLARRNLADDTVNLLRFHNKTLTINPRDGHRNTVVGISPDDGRLHLSWDHHNNPLRYTKSRRGVIEDPPAKLTLEHFEPAQPLLPDDDLESRVTYPRFLNDSDGTLYFIYRQGGSGRGDNYIHRYQADSGTWKRMGTTGLFSRQGTYPAWENSTSRNAYLNDVLFDKRNRLHATWTYREAGRTWASNHDLHYAYSDDGGQTWRNNEGEQIANLTKGDSIELADPGIVVREIPVFSWLMNQTTMVLDSRNRPHVITYHLTEPFPPERLEHDPPAEVYPKLRMHHYWRDDNGTWQGGNTGVPLRTRPGVVVDDEDSLVVYHVDQGKLRCLLARPEENWRDWKSARMPVPGLTLHKASKPDRYLATAEGILSMVAITREPDGERGLAILDFSAVSHEL
ncbi:MAG: BNR repeat-containing protein [Planctomycetota bacterium]